MEFKISDGVFYGWEGDVDREKGIVIPEGVHTIAYFGNVNFIGKIVIPKGVKKISRYAFNEGYGWASGIENRNDFDIACSLVIPEGVTEIEDRAFYIHYIKEINTKTRLTQKMMGSNINAYHYFYGKLYGPLTVNDPALIPKCLQKYAIRTFILQCDEDPSLLDTERGRDHLKFMRKKKEWLMDDPDLTDIFDFESL